MRALFLACRVCFLVSSPGGEEQVLSTSSHYKDINPITGDPPSSVQFSSVTQSCLTPCDPMNHSTPGLPVHHQFLEFLTLMSIELVMPSNHLLLFIPFSSRLQSFPASGSFPVSQFFKSGGQRIGVSASASVLPMDIQD